MNLLKRFAGIIWLIAGPVLIFFLVKTAFAEIARNPVIDTKVQWSVFVIIFIPIAIGFSLFGWIAFQGGYDQLPEKSEDIG